MDAFDFSLKKISELSWVAFDTEATGYSNVSDRIVEVAGVRFHRDKGRWVEEGVFCELVCPGRPIPELVTKIHGIRDEDVARADSPLAVLERFFAFVGDSVLLAHYAPFDAGVITFAHAREKRRVPSLFILDTFPLTKGVLPGLPHYSLEAAVTHIGKAPAVSHRALPDAQATHSVFMHCVEKLGDPDTMQVGSLLEHTGPPVTFEQFVDLPTELPAKLYAIELAIAEHHDVEIEYRGGSRGPVPRRLTPTHLFARDGRVFVEGICHIDRSRKSFRIDRIIKAEKVAAGSETSETTS